MPFRLFPPSYSDGFASGGSDGCLVRNGKIIVFKRRKDFTCVHSLLVIITRTGILTKNTEQL